ncbi:biotinidase [Genypterus blacodes]|uniref:biotinidase n=1 Tax=Genypterus blacodes TaxID=154954 RepID=UPI003F75D9C3
MLLSLLLSIVAVLVVTPGLTEAGSEASYVAAVYEHRVIMKPESAEAPSRPAALLHLNANLDVYEQQAARAAQQGAQILVFPEYGLQGFNFTRSSISGYLETTPDPQQERWNPCTEPSRYNNTEVLQRLSCMARRHRLYLVANMPGMQPCPLQTDPSSSCPPDGRWQFNTNIVFSSDGLLVARYHKNNLYFEKAFDTPPQTEIITFDTPFAGRFGLLICFDIVFHNPKINLFERGVRQLVYPAAWKNQLPLMAAVQFQRAVSLGAGVTILAANIRSDADGMTGSGIFTPMSPPLRHHARHGEPEEGRLLVARVPVLDPLWVGPGEASEGRQGGREVKGEVWSSKTEESGFCVEEQGCSDPPLPHPPPYSSVSPPAATFNSSMMYDPFTFALLGDAEGELDVCDGSFCCHLQYRQFPQGSSKELYALGAFGGTHTFHGRIALQVCALVRCAGAEASSCGQEVEEAETKMDFLLEGRFGTRHVYPSVLASGLVLEQPERLERTAGGRVAMTHSNMTAGLVTACLYGRMYHLDQH